MITRSYKVRKKGFKRGEQREYPFYPNQLFRILMSIMGAVAVVAIVAALFPLPLGQIADPLAEPDTGTGALWILKPALLLKTLVLSPRLTILLIFSLAALFVFLPILDPSGHRSIRRRIIVAVPFLLWMLFLAVSLLFAFGVPS